MTKARNTTRKPRTKAKASADRKAVNAKSPRPTADQPKTHKNRKSTTAASKRPSSRTPSKASTIVGLLHGNDGASLAELQQATGWQPHSVRGFLSGTIKKRMGLALTSERDADGERRYRIVEG
ncbi:DUF3489 domain-containing protein [Pyruvatibacter sp.]|uniref:DUF3489 domain-containing protein n=1 Tax=Pyruvatibacter sp. TaxID=1981328 RepID=UPI0032EB6BCB